MLTLPYMYLNTLNLWHELFEPLKVTDNLKFWPTSMQMLYFNVYRYSEEEKNI